MDALIHQFFNLDIMARSLPLVLAGLRQTLLICLIVIPLGLAGGLVFALASLLARVHVPWNNWQGRELMSRGERSAWIEPSADVPLRRDFRESEW